MLNRSHIGFPVLAVKFSIGHLGKRGLIDTTEIDTDAIGIRPGHIVGLYSACSTKMVFRDMRIKGVARRIAPD